MPRDSREKGLLAENGRIDPALQRLAHGLAQKGVGELETLAKKLSVPLEGDRVAVRLGLADNGDPEGMTSRIEAMGGGSDRRYGGRGLCHPAGGRHRTAE
ncbi:MAG: hypothetical protein KJ558_11790 [Gammaproteobacteria bacterium]|nr:hypothetical protein [Gammaproteobacteria bacterium]MBU1655485.1 hypothetical protein [Gammaproteobacteria bacterium]MBU1961053.1 hypothetical protein [Gammaproteobacteria bacterium]